MPLYNPSSITGLSYSAAYTGPNADEPPRPVLVATPGFTVNQTLVHTTLSTEGINVNITYTPPSDASSGNMRGVFSSVHHTGTKAAYILSAFDGFAQVDGAAAYLTIQGGTFVGATAGASSGTGALIGVAAGAIQQSAGATVPLVISVNIDPTSGGIRSLLGTISTAFYGLRITGMSVAGTIATATRAGIYIDTMAGSATASDYAIHSIATQAVYLPNCVSVQLPTGAFIGPAHTGGSGNTSTIKIYPTVSAGGTTGADIIFAGGNNGGSEWGRIPHGGGLVMGLAGTLGGTVSMAGATSGSGTLRVNSIAGSAVITLPAHTGNLQAGLKTRVTAQSAANASICTYTVPAADASFHVSMNMNVSAATAISTTMTCTYTDEQNIARTLILPVTQLSGSFIALGAVTGTGAWETPILHIRCKGGSVITLLTAAGTFTGVTYTAEGLITTV